MVIAGPKRDRSGWCSSERDVLCAAFVRARAPSVSRRQLLGQGDQLGAVIDGMLAPCLREQHKAIPSVLMSHGRRQLPRETGTRSSRVILAGMKTAVSIPDPLTRAADRIARRLGISRSELYTRALEQLIDRESDDETTRRLDEVYSTEDPRLEPDIVRAQRRAGGDAS
jgi:hypothetical protein